MHPEDEGYERRGRAGLMAGTGDPLEPPHASALYLGQPPPGRVRGYSPAQPAAPSPRVAPSSPVTLTDLRPVPPPPAGQPLPEQPQGQQSIRRPRTWPQRVGGVLIAAAVVATGLWYIPSVMHDNSQLLTGTVASSGVITLNFSDAGEIAEIDAKLNTSVRKGQILAKEYAPDASSVLAADKAAMAADEAKIAQVKEAEAADPANAAVDNAQLSAAHAQLALDQAQLATDQMKIVTTEIVAPSGGVRLSVHSRMRASSAGVSVLAPCPACLLNNPASRSSRNRLLQRSINASLQSSLSRIAAHVWPPSSNNINRPRRASSARPLRLVARWLSSIRSASVSTIMFSMNTIILPF